MKFVEDEQRGWKKKGGTGGVNRECTVTEIVPSKGPSGMFDCRLARKSSEENTKKVGQPRSRRTEVGRQGSNGLYSRFLKARGCRKHDFIDFPH